MADLSLGCCGCDTIAVAVPGLPGAGAGPFTLIDGGDAETFVTSTGPESLDGGIPESPYVEGP